MTQGYMNLLYVKYKIEEGRPKKCVTRVQRALKTKTYHAILHTSRTDEEILAGQLAKAELNSPLPVMGQGDFSSHSRGLIFVEILT